MEAGIYQMLYKKEQNAVERNILGKEFVINNRNKGKLIINNRKFPLENIATYGRIRKNKIKIIFAQNIYNISFMFNNCKSLISFTKLSNDDDEENLRIAENVVNTENNEQIKENELFPNSTSHDNTSDFYNTNKNSFSAIDKFSIIDEKDTTNVLLNFKLKALNHN